MTTFHDVTEPLRHDFHKYKMSLADFVNNHCVACGGNWTQMLMAGIEKQFPEEWAAMEDREYLFPEVIEILKRNGVTW